LGAFWERGHEPEVSSPPLPFIPCTTLPLTSSHNTSLTRHSSRPSHTFTAHPSRITDTLTFHLLLQVFHSPSFTHSSDAPALTTPAASHLTAAHHLHILLFPLVTLPPPSSVSSHHDALSLDSLSNSTFSSSICIASIDLRASPTHPRPPLVHTSTSHPPCATRPSDSSLLPRSRSSAHVAVTVSRPFPSQSLTSS
jgi:hypothetical protein